MKELTLEMTQKQINRYHLVKESLEGKMTVPEVAKHLGISERQVTRLRKGVKEKGAAFLIHKSKGVASSKALSSVEKDKIQKLYRSRVYNGANFLHFSELIAEKEDINLSYSTVCKILKEAGIESPKKRRRYKPHRRRKRKEQEGLLIQMDATPYRWFGGNAMYALHGAIDDATGKIVGAYMTKNECLQGYFETMRQIIEQNGVPIAVYADRHAIFRSPKADKLTVQEQLEGKQVADTQFGRAMKELGINLIAARSPQAKGRIERLWETLQSRLVIEFRLHKITNIHEANLFLCNYIPKFNKQFALKAEQSELAYAPLAKDLELILCVKEKRITDNGGVFSFHGKLFKITSNSIVNKAKIEVIASANMGIIAMYKGKKLDVLPYIKPKRISKSNPTFNTKQYSPPDEHYYKHGKPAIPLFSSDLVDREIHKMLQDIFLSKYA
jgi:transposase